MNMFDLFNGFWKWASENNDKNTPNITAMYFYLVHLNNELNWIDTFTITSTQTMHYMGIGAFKTYKDTLDKLEQYGLIRIVQRSSNQFTCTRVGMVKLLKAKLIADAKQSKKHLPKQMQSNVENTSHIHKTLIDLQNSKDLKEIKGEKIPKKKKEAPPEVFFTETPEGMNFQIFAEKWNETNFAQLHTQIDPFVLWGTMRDWSNENSPQKNKRSDWLAVGRTFVKKDPKQFIKSILPHGATDHLNTADRKGAEIISRAIERSRAKNNANGQNYGY